MYAHDMTENLYGIGKFIVKLKNEVKNYAFNSHFEMHFSFIRFHMYKSYVWSFILQLSRRQSYFFVYPH